VCSNTDIHLTSQRCATTPLTSNNLVLACRLLLQWLPLTNLHRSDLPLSLHWLISNPNFSRHSRSSQFPPTIRFHIASDRRSCFICWTDTSHATEHSLVRIPLRRGVLDKTLCHKVCQQLASDRWFSPVSSTNKTDCPDITKTLLKVALNTITPTLLPSLAKHWWTYLGFPHVSYRCMLNLFSGIHVSKTLLLITTKVT